MLLDQWGINSSYFCGFSMGGYVILRAALSYPEKDRGLILVDSAPYVLEHTVKVAGEWAEILLNSGWKPLWRPRSNMFFTLFSEEEMKKLSIFFGRVSKSHLLKLRDE